jgi:hypothetical protein
LVRVVRQVVAEPGRRVFDTSEIAITGVSMVNGPLPVGRRREADPHLSGTLAYQRHLIRP